jgi:hypothetical protein
MKQPHLVAVATLALGALGALGGVAAADRPIDLMVEVPLDPATVPANVNSKVVYLNSCKPNGCVIRQGTPSSLTDSWYAQGTLTPFSDSDATWQGVVRCIRETFSAFDVDFTEVDPGTAPHFEIMIAGTSTDIGLSANVGGISPYSCSSAYYPNSLVFDFSKTWSGDVNEICAVAAQEIAHSFTLDHTTTASDPLTYFKYTGRRAFPSAAVQCGSDCTNSSTHYCVAGDTGCRAPNVGINGAPACTGSPPQNHPCACTGNSTQNAVQTITALFGARAAIPPPTVTLTFPTAGAPQTAGFPVRSDVTLYLDLAKVELIVDGASTQSLLAGPYIFNAPATLTTGVHHVEVRATDVKGTIGSAKVDVTVVPPCQKPADCADTTQTCVGGRCVPGSGVQGGLGSVCTDNTGCASGQCGSDGAGHRYCVEPCAPATAGSCPSNFDCLASGATGVCWPAANNGGGGGCATDAPAGPLLFGLGLAALILRRRRTA